MVSDDGRMVMIEILPQEGLDPQSLNSFVHDIRSAGSGPSELDGLIVRVGGLPAFNVDYQEAVAGRFMAVAGLVVLTTFVSLLVGTRSVLIPLKATVLNLLSVGAAFGALRIVFQEGMGSKLLGVEPMGAVFSSLPVIVFCIVFGLSMDYEVFLIGRVLEGKRAGLDDRKAIIEGVAHTGPVITNAAAVMLAVFVTFAFGEFLIIKLLGFTLAVAIFLDATVVRIVIGPALLQLAGKWNWWPAATVTRSGRSQGETSSHKTLVNAGGPQENLDTP
jgi:RND superfamily putative drug exporter